MIPALCEPVSQWIEYLYNQLDMTKMTEYTSESRSPKVVHFPSCFSGHHSAGSQLPGIIRTKAAQWRDLHREELRPPANSQVSGSSSLCQALRWPWPLLTQWLQPHENLSQDYQLSFSQIPDPQKLWGDGWCFKPLSFEVIHYTAIENPVFQYVDIQNVLFDLQHSSQ